MKHKAFSLIELMIVVSIIGLLLGIAVPSFNGIRLKQGFLEEVTFIADVIADARANAISSKQCTLGDKTKVQSRAWAMRINAAADEPYFLELQCQSYINDEWYSQPSTGHNKTNDLGTLDTLDDIIYRDLSTGGLVNTISAIGFPSNTAGLTLTSNKLDYDGNALPRLAGRASFEDGFIRDNGFQIIFTDLAKEIYIDVDNDGVDDLQDFDPVFYIALSNDALDYVTVSSGSSGSFFAAHNYGICMDTRKGFVQVPCALTLQEN